MVPALSALSRTPAAPVRRLAFSYIPNGAIMEQWTPAAEEGTAFELPPILASLEPHRDRLVVLSGLDSRPAEAAEGEGSGDHARASAVWLSGIHPKRTQGADVRGARTIDQMAADALGRDTQLRSLEVAAEDFTAVGGCDIGYSCSYVNTLSWRTATTPLPMQTDPRVVFERLFGEASVRKSAGGSSGGIGASWMRLSARWPACGPGSAPPTPRACTSIWTASATWSSACGG